jgi:hypothetical protein
VQRHRHFDGVPTAGVGESSDIDICMIGARREHPHAHLAPTAVDLQEAREHARILG